MHHVLHFFHPSSALIYSYPISSASKNLHWCTRTITQSYSIADRGKPVFFQPNLKLAASFRLLEILLPSSPTSSVRTLIRLTNGQVQTLFDTHQALRSSQTFMSNYPCQSSIASHLFALPEPPEPPGKAHKYVQLQRPDCS